MSPVVKERGLLYPMLLIAAIGVIVLSATGIATMMGWMPGAMSRSESPARTDQPDRRAAAASIPSPGAPLAAGPATRATPPAPACRHCGVVESIRAIETQGPDSWLGAAGGAVLGGLLGNQVGHGRGRTAATVAGAGAGAYAGNEIEKRMSRSVRYQVRVRMNDGTHRTFHETAQPAYAVGQPVRVTPQGTLAAR